MNYEFIHELLVKLGPDLQGPVITGTLLYLARKASKISRSLIALNGKIAVVIDRVDSHEKRISVIERQGKPAP